VSKADAAAPTTATTLPRSAPKSISSAVWARSAAGSAATASGVHQPPTPSWPVASTALRARIGPALVSTFKQGSPSSVRPGVMRPAATSFRTGTPTTRRNQSRYSCQSSVGTLRVSAKRAASNRASCQAW
jgi:hypothetical protein